jgi:hypothetical protein
MPDLTSGISRVHDSQERVLTPDPTSGISRVHDGFNRSAGDVYF